MTQLWSMGPWWDRSFDVEVSGNFAYVADYEAGLWVVDITTPESPEVVGHLDTKEKSWGLAVRGNYVYLADGFAGMRIIDVSNAANPVEMSTVPVSSQAYDVTLDPAQDIAYVAGWGAGVRIINVANPASPYELGYFDTSNECNDIELAGNTAFVADAWEGLLILNVANPAAPTVIGTFPFPGTRTVDVELSGTLAYIAAGGVYVLDITNPAAPVIVDSSLESYDPSEIALSGSYAFVSDSWGVMHVLDISSPQHPVPQLYIGTNGSAPAIAVSGNYAYVAATDGGLCVADISDPLNPFTVAFPATHIDGLDVAVQGNIAIVANRQNGWRILDVTNPASPTVLTEVSAVDAANGCDLVGTTAYVASEGAGLLIYDMTTPATPALLGQYDSPGIALDVTVVGNTAYLCDAFAGLHILDVSTPAAPVLIGSYDTPDWAQDVEIRGDYAYVCDGYADVRILDISVPTAPVEVSFVDGDNAQAIAFKDNYAFVATGHVVQVLDISNPLAPFQATTFPISWTRDLTLVGNFLFVAASEQGLRAYDVSNPLAAIEVGNFTANGVAQAVYVSDSVAYVADRVYFRTIDVSNVLAYTGPRPCLSCVPADANLGTITETVCGASVSGSLINGGKWTAEFTASEGEVFHWDLCPQLPCGGTSNFHTGDPDILILDSDCNILVWEDGPGDCGYAPNDFQWTCPVTGNYYIALEPYNGSADLHCGGDVNDTFTLVYYREPVSETTGRCCYDAGNSCVNVTEFECAGLAGTWDSTQVCLGCGCNSSTQELTVDGNTALLLHFNNSPNGASGELPTQATGITYSTARFYEGASLSTGDQLRFNASGNITATQGTLECWLKPEWNGNDNDGHMILVWGGGGGLLMSKDGANNLRIILNRYSAGGNPEQGVATNIGSWLANEWHHVAFTWNASMMKVYVDGSPINQNPVTITLPNITATTFQIGGEGTGSYLRAQVDELRISNAPRTDQEIAQSYINGLFISSLTADPAILNLYPTWTTTPTLTAQTDVGTRTLPASQAAWTSSNPAVASVTAEGVVEALAGGSAVITATYQCHEAQVVVNVTAPLLPPVWETLDPFLTTPAANAQYEMPVLIISYLPTSNGVSLDPDIAGTNSSLTDMRAYIETLSIRSKFMLEEGSKFRGFDNPNARPSLGYRVVGHVTVFEPLPAGPGTPENHQPDYRQVLTRFDAAHWVNDLGVKEVWLWGYHYGSLYPVESNMSSPTTGDISNSYRLDDLPIYDHTYILYNYNFTRSQAEAVHDHGHQLEAALSHVNWLQDGNANLFWHQFSGQNASGQTILGRCGNTHIPPNTLNHYDYLNPAVVQSDIRAWTPAGGPTTAVDYHTWGDHPYQWPYGEWNFSQREESQWYIFWMQSMPGFANTIPYNTTSMTNWWTFTAQWDEAITAGMGLYGDRLPIAPDLVISPSGNDLQLRWTPNGNLPEVTQYEVYRASTLDGPYFLMTTIPDTFFLHVNGVLNGDMGFYRVIATAP